jgi:hypothetical protein
MNATPTDGHEVGTDEQAAGPLLPTPRSGTRRLPRRTREGAALPVGPGPEPARDPDGRPFEPVDEATLTRLLSGLREI